MFKSLFKKAHSNKIYIAVIWLALFSLAALLSHVMSLSGIHADAYPEQAYLPPFQSLEHVLGTDHLGRDLLLYLLLSCKSAWLLSFPPILAATVIGVILGTGAALVGNKGLKLPVQRSVIAILSWSLFTYIFYVEITYLHTLPYFMSCSVYGVSVVGLVYFLLATSTLRSDQKTSTRYLSIAVDDVLRRIIDIWSSLPKLLLLLILTSITPFSISSLMFWICATYWVLPARVARASVLRVREENYFETASALGIPLNKTFRSYIWPAMRGPILTNFCFAASGLLGIGSTMAFLGIGLPADVPSWGKMLANARYSVEYWWLLTFPALLLLVSILSLQAIGNRFSSQLERTTVTN